MRIHSLLNPYGCGDRHEDRGSESPTPAITPRSVVPSTDPPKRQKIPKDAAIFTDGAKVNGPVNYPPHEVENDPELATYHRKFQVYPSGNIRQKGPRRIPYNSDKKDFMNKTGRDAFEVFQYQFKLPGDEKDYIMLWDYQVGLVRMTALFKCCKYSKTTPAKVLSLNPGLREISYSITGGALAAQGYWMPFEAAKAVAATFCYNIRHVLTPIFGKEFLSKCVHPKDPTFGKFLIDPAIVKDCTEDSRQWKQRTGSGKAMAKSNLSVGSPKTPQLKFTYPPWGVKSTRSRRARAGDSDSDYATDEDLNERFLFSPEISPRSTAWASVNRSQSPATLPPYSPPEPWVTSAPREFQDESIRTKRTFSKIVYGEDGRPQTASSTIDMELASDSSSYIGNGSHTMKELGAAEILLQLSAADSMVYPSKRTRHGSRY